MVVWRKESSECWGRGLHSFSPNFKWKIIDVAEVNQRRCLEESEQWLVNGDRTHLVLASGKSVLQKLESSEYEKSNSVETKREGYLISITVTSQKYELVNKVWAGFTTSTLN